MLLKYVGRWNQDRLIVNLTKLQQYCKNLHKSAIKSPKLKSLQYRLLLNNIVTNMTLKQWKMLECDDCTFCKSAPESTLHLLYECNMVQAILKEICKLWRSCDSSVVVNSQDYIFNSIYEKSDHNMMLQECFFIWNKKVINPSVLGLVKAWSL